MQGRRCTVGVKPKNTDNKQNRSPYGHCSGCDKDSDSTHYEGSIEHPFKDANKQEEPFARVEPNGIYVGDVYFYGPSALISVFEEEKVMKINAAVASREKALRERIGELENELKRLMSVVGEVDFACIEEALRPSARAGEGKETQ
jgi:hypothetical protein